MIVYGWGLYGRSNVRTTQGSCAQCGYHGPMRHYDARVYGTLYFIPLLPLSGRHVAMECPSCRTATVAPRGKWRKLCRNEFEPAIETYLHEPTDAQAAVRAVEAAVLMADDDRFTEIALAVERHLPDDPRVIGAMARAYATFDMHPEAQAAFMAWIGQEEPVPARSAYVTYLMHTGEFEKAADQVFALAESHGDKCRDAAVTLAYGMLHDDQPTQAAKFVRQLGENIPALLDDKDLKYILKTAENPGELKRVHKQRKKQAKKIARTKTNPLLRRVPTLGLVTVLSFAALIYILVCTNKQPSVYIVNGLDRTYPVLVNGQRKSIPGKKSLPVKVGYGRITVKLDNHAINHNVTLTTDTWFLLRPFDDTIHVVNLDRAAVLTMDRTPYTDTNYRRTLNPPEPTYHVGKNLYAFHGIDYPFQALPLKIEMPESKRVVWKTSLSIETQATVSDVVLWLLEQKRQAEAIQTGRTALEIQPGQDALLPLLLSIMPRKAFLAFLQPGLTATPVRVQWHRMYQQVQQEAGQEQSLEATYRKLYEDHPREQAYAYLLGRLVSDPDESQKLYEQAVGGEAPCPYGHLGLSHRLLKHGQFEQALAHSTLAVKSLPDNYSASYLHYNAQLANHAYDAIYEQTMKQLRTKPGNLDQHRVAMIMLALAGRREELAQAKRELLTTLAAQKITAEEQQTLQRTFDLDQAEATRDRAALIAALTDSPDPNHAFYLALLTGQPDQAAQHVEGLESFDPATARLLIYLVSQRQAEPDHREASSGHFDVAIETLRQQGSDGPWLAGMLTADRWPDLDRVFAHCDTTDFAKVFLLALAERFPVHKADLLAHARKLNFHPWMPGLLVQELTEQP